MKKIGGALLLLGSLFTAMAGAPAGKVMMTDSEWERLSGFFVQLPPVTAEQRIPQGWGRLQYNLDLLGKSRIRLAGKEHETGFGCHVPSRIHIHTEKPVRTFSAFCGYAENASTERDQGKYPQIFTVEANGKTLFESRPLSYGEVQQVCVTFPAGTCDFELTAKGVNGNHRGHVAWGSPLVELSDGRKLSPAVHVPALGRDFPVTFQYDGHSSAEFFSRHPAQIEETRESGKVTRLFTASDGVLQVKVTMTLRRDLPVWEWHTEFANVSKKRSGRLSRVRVLSLAKEMPYAIFFDWIRHRGGFDSPIPAAVSSDRFLKTFEEVRQNCELPFETELSCGEGGRPTDEWLPCFDLTDGKETVRAVLGWAGSWSGRFVNDTIKAQIELGLTDFDAVLEPGEKVTMPAAYLLVAPGGTEKAVNLWRRFVKKYVMAGPDGRAPKLELFNSHWGGMSAKEQVQAWQLLKKTGLPVDTFWIDAGWFAPHSNDEFESVWYNHVGDLAFHPGNYPDELVELSQQLHADGKKLLLWFEPERVRRTSRIAQEHPEYLIDVGTDDLLLDLGNPQAWQWCHDAVYGIIQRNKIDWFRVDFNFNPRPYWLKKDAPGRRGMTEVRYVEGLYRLWRTLRKEFPGLMIDNCASGGRRLDVELLRDSVPLWYSDMFCGSRYQADFALVEHAGMAGYCPLFGGGSGIAGDTYQFRASLSPYCSYGTHYNTAALGKAANEKKMAWRRARLQEYLHIRDTLTGDFYLHSLAKPNSAGVTWTVFQYDLPEAGRGSVMLFRPQGSPVSEIELKLRALDENARYRLTGAEKTLPPVTASGKELMERGIRVRLEECRSSNLVFYDKL